MNATTVIDFITVQAVSYAPKILAAIVIIFGFKYVYKFSRKPLISVLEKLKLEKPIIKLLVDSGYKWLLIIFGGLMAMGQLGIDVGAVLAGLGVAGVAIGFAAQDSISNIIAGFVIFLDKPFKVGDWVKVSDHYGEVWEITMRSTRIRTTNHTYVVIPNKTIIDEVLDNHSKYGATRIEVPVGIAYKESIDQAREILLKAASVSDLILEKPAPAVVVNELGDSSVNLLVRVWVDEAGNEPAAYVDVMEACKKALDQADIEIPFPHMQLFLDEVKEKAVKQLGELVKQ